MFRPQPKGLESETNLFPGNGQVLPGEANQKPVPQAVGESREDREARLEQLAITDPLEFERLSALEESNEEAHYIGSEQAPH